MILERKVMTWSRAFGVLVLLGLYMVFAPTGRAAPIALRAQPALLEMAAQQPEANVGVIVQKTVRDSTVEDLVARLDGRVTRDLHIINAFAAEMKAKTVLELAHAEGVRWISLDAPVQSSDSTTAVSTAWSTRTGLAVTSSFTNTTAIIDSAFGPNGAFGVGANNTKGSFTAFDIEATEGNAVSKVEVLLSAYSRFINHDFKIKVWLGGKQIKEYAVKHELFAGLTTPATAGQVVVDITGAKNWTWADFDNQLELYLDLSPFDGKDWLYLDAVGLRVTSAPGTDTTAGGAPTSLPKAAIDTSNLVNVYNKVVRAPEVWNDPLQLLQGQGVTVAVIDSGITKHYDLKNRLIAKINLNRGYHDSSDRYGHGTFVASVLAGDGSESKGQFIGIAPKTNVVNVRISDDRGMATESDVVNGLQWALDNRAKYNIRVVNMSLNSSVAQSYHTSPIDAAAEILWFNGIVVVVSVGNNGTANLYAPANDPFVITVGATKDQGTITTADDVIASFSAYGTTEVGTTKPELVAPGTNIIAFLPENGKTTIGNAHGANRVNANYFRMSGTSMAAPVVSGAVALLLQDEPNLTPDQVKYRLMATANKNWPGYDAARAGAGYLDIYAAIKGTTTKSANTGINISKLLTTGPESVLGPSVSWNSVSWNSVSWNSVSWNSVSWNSVSWNSVSWNSDYWGQ